LQISCCAYLLRKSVYSAWRIIPVLIIMAWKHCRSMAHSLQSLAAANNDCQRLHCHPCAILYNLVMLKISFRNRNPWFIVFQSLTHMSLICRPETRGVLIYLYASDKDLIIPNEFKTNELAAGSYIVDKESLN
jgi:hypothetical protein